MLSNINYIKNILAASHHSLTVLIEEIGIIKTIDQPFFSKVLMSYQINTLYK